MVHFLAGGRIEAQATHLGYRLQRFLGRRIKLVQTVGIVFSTCRHVVQDGVGGQYLVFQFSEESARLDWHGLSGQLFEQQ